MADPFSAVLQKFYRRDSTSLLIALLLGYALVAFGIAAGISDALRWLIGATAALSFAAGLAAFGYAFLFKPDRLRSEETIRMDMVLAWLNRPDVDDAHRTSAERLLPIVWMLNRAKRLSAQRQTRRKTMRERVYAVIFDQLDPSFDPVAMRDAMRNEKRIAHWWNHIPNCFLVSTGLSPAEVAALVKKHSGEVGFFVIEADPGQSEGYLPKRSWSWIQEREKERSSEAVS